jgi:hypothetical protein
MPGGLATIFAHERKQARLGGNCKRLRTVSRGPSDLGHVIRYLGNRLTAGHPPAATVVSGRLSLHQSDFFVIPPLSAAPALALAEAWSCAISATVLVWSRTAPLVSSSFTRVPCFT